MEPHEDVVEPATGAIDGYPQFKQVIDRCNAIGIDCRTEKDNSGNTYLEVSIPEGRDKRPIRIRSLSHLRDFLGVPIERFKFLRDYVAVCSYQDGTIEAEIEILSPKKSGPFGQYTEGVSFYFILRNSGMFSPLKINAIEGEYLSCQQGNVQISMGPFEYLGALKDSLPTLTPLSDVLDTRRIGTSLKIRGLQIQHHDPTVDLLERVANSVFFQIDHHMNVALALKKKPPNMETQITSHVDGTQFDLQFPRYEYDEDPMQLYWYGKRAQDMPLLQFLAYYQVIEFYFPVYSQEEAMEKIRRILKRPGFRAENDTDMRQVMITLQNHPGKGFGRERDQLECTIRACVDKDTLRAFLSEEKEMHDFFCGKANGLKSCTIPIKTPNADLRSAAAERIYQIRCRIVHAKGEGGELENEPILPFSKEADLLFYDIALVQYVARQALIKGSRALQLEARLDL